MDADEEAIRSGNSELAIELFGACRTPFDPSNIQRAKAPSSPDEKEFVEAIAETVLEEIEAEPNAVYIFGPGSVKTAIMEHLGIDASFLGVDVLKDGGLLGSDLNERKLLALLDDHENAKVVITPIGAQGFVLGRGNQQISADVITAVGIDNIIFVATPQKLARTPKLFAHTGDINVDKNIDGYQKILVGYRTWEMRKVESV